MNIAMLSVHSCPMGRLGGRDTGGMQVYVRELAAALGKRGHLVDIYTRTHQPPHPQVADLAQNVHLIHLNDGGGQSPKVALYAYMEDFTCGMESFRKSRGRSYDIIHSHYWLSGLAGMRLHDGWRIPHVVMFHTLGAVKNALGIGEEETDLRIETERMVARSCDRIVAATPRERQELVRRCGAPAERVRIIPCGVNLDLFRPLDRNAAREELGIGSRKVVLFVGRIDPVKGLDLLLRAMSHVDGNEPPLLLVLGGDEHSGSDIRGLRSLALALGLQDRVRFHGLVPQERLPGFYCAADVCVIPSHYESFGMVALESLACGTPVVARDVGGMRTVVQGPEMGWVVEAEGPEPLAAAIAGVLSQGVDGHAAIARRRQAMKFGWDQVCEQVLGEYRVVMGAAEPATSTSQV